MRSVFRPLACGSATVVLICSACHLCGIWFRFGIAHFSIFGDSTSSLFVCSVRIRFEPFNNINHYLAAFVLPGVIISFLGQYAVFLITAICLLILSLSL